MSRPSCVNGGNQILNFLTYRDSPVSMIRLLSGKARSDSTGLPQRSKRSVLFV
jgi:hypothetical protein